jgi:mannonate dehydratase
MQTNSNIKIGKGLGDVAEETLRFFRQIGVEEVGMPARYITEPGTPPTRRPHVPPTQTGPAGSMPPPWDDEELRAIRARMGSFGLTPTMMSLPLSGNILLGRGEREADLEIVRANIAAAGRVGVRVLTYSFTALRPSEGYGSRDGGGRGGADLRDFDHARICDLPPLASVGTHSHEQMWERVDHFLRAVVPVAEAAGVRLAAHPNDPPVPVYRGVAQPLSNLDGLKRLIELVDSPANCVFFDTGVTTEMGEDAVAAIRYFGERQRIGTVHFRNVRVETPRYKYVETFHDDGDCDLFACMEAFHRVGYDGLIDPDHTPGITGDTFDTRMGWAFAIGQIVAMRNAVVGRKSRADQDDR